MAEPLANPAPARAAAPAPQPAAPVQAPVQAPAQSPAAAEAADAAYEEPAAPHEAEPSLFDRGVAAARAAADDLPPPAYRPAAPAAPQRDLHVEDEAAFVAPRPRAAGTPTPEALARLKAAVARAPVAAGRPLDRSEAPRAEARPEARSPADRPRFGINSLINRMTGHGAETPARSLPPLRSDAAAHPAYDDEPPADPEAERIEIPAFLRRQAN
jgi:cell division protein FtsZ